MNKLLNLTVLIASSMLSGAVMAGSAFTSLDITATVGSGCFVSATNIDFGSTDAQDDVVAGGSIEVNCTSGLPYNVSLDAGLHFDAGLGVRTVQNSSGHQIAYYLFDPVSATEWGDSDFSNTYPSGTSVAGSGTGAPQSLVVSGLLSSSVHPGNIFTPGTSYADTVYVTVDF